MARATLSAAAIAVFFSFISWMLVSYYGPAQVVDAAGATLESGDSTTFVLAPMVELFWPWAGITSGILLVTSLLAGSLRSTTASTATSTPWRYEAPCPSSLPAPTVTARPAVAAWIQSATAVVLVARFALLALDPVLTLFFWFSGLAVAALLVLYIMCSLAGVGFFRRERAEGQLWQTLIASALAALLLAWVLYLVVSNFTALIGGSAETATALGGCLCDVRCRCPCGIPD